MITVNEETKILTPDTINVVTEGPLLVTRPYDFEAGDIRKFTQEEAIAAARLRVKDRGSRQSVRQADVAPADQHLTPRWLVQDI